MATAFTLNSPNSSPFTFESPSTPTPLGNSYRKRVRQSISHIQDANNFFSQRNDWSNFAAASSITRSADAGSPAPLADTRYVFAGGVSTPSAQEDIDERYDRADNSTYTQYRRRWSLAGDEQQQQQQQQQQQSMEATMGEDEQRNGKRKLETEPGVVGGPGWGRFVFNIVGGVAGKMWDFCRGAAVKGFYAGGGEGYDLPPGADQQQLQHQSNMQMAQSVWNELESRPPQNPFERSPIPGQFPSEQPSFPEPPTAQPQPMATEPTIPEQPAFSQPPIFTDQPVFTEQPVFGFQKQESPPRPSKRIHTDSGTGWVMVTHDNNNNDSRASSPHTSQRSSNNPATPSRIPRPSSFMQAPASAGSTHRRSLLPTSTRRSSGVSLAGASGHRASLSNVVFRPASQTSPSLHERQYSRDAYNSPAIVSPRYTGSPLSPEVQRYAARLRREEWDTDASMDRLSAQLNALIREGKEALQSKVELSDAPESQW